jgi:hypothetical protein
VKILSANIFLIPGIHSILPNPRPDKPPLR